MCEILKSFATEPIGKTMLDADKLVWVTSSGSHLPGLYELWCSLQSLAIRTQPARQGPGLTVAQSFLLPPLLWLNSSSTSSWSRTHTGPNKWKEGRERGFFPSMAYCFLPRSYQPRCVLNTKYAQLLKMQDVVLLFQKKRSKKKN